MSDSNLELVPDAELVELFRRRRPDPAAFRARVAARIAEKEREAACGDAPASPRADILRRAAALLPLDSTLGPGGASGPLKLALASLALPFVVLFASVAAFVAAGRSVQRSARSAPRAETEPSLARDAARASSRRLHTSGLLAQLLQPLAMSALLLPSLTGAAWAVDIVVAVVLVAAATLALLVRGLADEALLTPRSVATSASSILGALFVGLFLWPHARRAAEAGSDLGLGWSAAVLFAGIVACALLPRARPSAGTITTLVFVTALVLLNPLGLTKSSPASVRRQLAELELSADDITRWEQAGLAAEALAAAGERDLPLGALEREVEHALGAGIAAHPRVWSAASQAGLMTHARWCALAERPADKRKLDQLLALEIPLAMPEYDEYLVPMLVATRELTREQRDALARRIDAAWPATGTHDPLADALLRVRLFEHLGLPERAALHRADVHALLRAHWFRGDGAAFYALRGGFTANPKEFPTSMVGSTHAAVALMARFGVPDEIDVRRVRAYLRGASAATWLLIPEPEWLKLEARAALLQLEREIGVPPRSLLASLAGERVLVACLLLVLLCALAIRSAPRPASHEKPDSSGPRGALP